MAVEGLLSRTVASLINGISQQPAAIRLKSQATAQVNCLSDVVTGVSRRPPTEHVSKLVTTAASSGYAVHFINRSATERYVVLIEDGAISVFGIDGTAKTITSTAVAKTGPAIDYLATTTPRDSIVMLTINDYTFIVNKEIVPAMSGNSGASSTVVRTQDHEFLLHIKNPPTAATVNLDLATHVAEGSGASIATNLSSKKIADEIMTALTGGTTGTDIQGATGFSANDWKFTHDANKSWVYGFQFQNLSPLDEVNADDTYGDTIHSLAATGVNGEDASVQNFSDLPPIGPPDFITKIAGADGNEDDDWYVRFDDDDKIWKETAQPGLDNEFNADTMPHVLVRTPGGPNDFEIKRADWADRTVGDANTAPEPSFIGNAINDVVLHKNRLCFVADENVVGSESGEFFNFWPTTVTTLVESDPIDISGSTRAVNIIDHAIPFQRNLTLFSSTSGVQTELVGADDKDLTVLNARIEPRAEFEVAAVEPVAVGPNLYFAVDRGEFTGFMEYTTDTFGIANADDVAAHLPEYVPSGVYHMAASRGENIITILADGDATALNELYVYRFLFLNKEKVQNSWSKWVFDANDELLYTWWLGSTMYLVVKRDGDIHLFTLSLRKSQDDAFGHRIHLDSLVAVTGTYDVPTDTTSWTLPFDPTAVAGTFMAILGSSFPAADVGAIVPLGTPTATTVTATGDLTAGDVWIGIKYESVYEPSEVVIDEGGSTTADTLRPILSGRVQVRKYRVLYNNTAYFRAEVSHRDDAATTYVHPFTGWVLGASSLGVTSLKTGTFEIDIGGRNSDIRLELKSDSPNPFSFTSMEWEAFYFARADRA